MSKQIHWYLYFLHITEDANLFPKIRLADQLLSSIMIFWPTQQTYNYPINGVSLQPSCKSAKEWGLESQLGQNITAVVGISSPYLHILISIQNMYPNQEMTLYWSLLLWSVSSVGNLSTTVTWSRQTSPTHSTGCMLSLHCLLTLCAGSSLAKLFWLLACCHT